MIFKFNQKATIFLSCFLRRYSHLHVVFFGNDDFSLPHLKSLINFSKSHEACDVDISELNIVTSDNSLVSKYCKSVNHPFLTWNADISKLINNFKNPNLGVIASFGKMIPEQLIDKFSHGIINVHPSLIPRWRGSSPIIYSLLHSDTLVGVTILQASKNKFDQGKILAQKSIEIDPFRHTRLSLTQLLSDLGVELLLTVIKDIDLYQSQAVSQPTKGVTISRKVSVNLVTIDWNTQTCQNIYTIYRAVGDLFQLHSKFLGVSVKLLHMCPNHEIDHDILSKLHDFSEIPGSVVYLKLSPNFFYIRCTDNWVGFKSIIVGRTEEKKRTLTAKEFYNGYLCRNRNSQALFSV